MSNVIKLNNKIQISTRAQSVEGYKKEINQLLHDIKSPLGALKVASECTNKSSDSNSELVRLAFERLDQMTLKLRSLSKQDIYLPTTEQFQALRASNIVKEIIAEKNIEYKHHQIKILLEIDKKSAATIINLQKLELKTIISNLINNSYEALSEKGSIKVKVENQGSELLIKIVDNGSGIPENLISKITCHGISYNKPKGSGLGLHHAKSTVESWNGKLEIASIENLGSKFTLRLPILPSHLRLIK